MTRNAPVASRTSLVRPRCGGARQSPIRSRHLRAIGVVALMAALVPAWLAAQQPIPYQLRGLVTDESGGVLPGVTIELRSEGAAPIETVTRRGRRVLVQRRPAGQISGGVYA